MLQQPPDSLSPIPLCQDPTALRPTPHMAATHHTLTNWRSPDLMLQKKGRPCIPEPWDDNLVAIAILSRWLVGGANWQLWDKPLHFVTLATFAASLPSAAEGFCNLQKHLQHCADLIKAAKQNNLSLGHAAVTRKQPQFCPTHFQKPFAAMYGPH